MILTKVLLVYTLIKTCGANADEGSVIDALRKTAEIKKGNVISATLNGKGKGLAGSLVGKTVTTTRKPDNDLPLFPGGGGSDDPSPVCLDMIILIDVSCSIKQEDRIIARDFAADVVNNLLRSTAADTRVGLVRYSQTVEQVFSLSEYDEVDEIVDAIRAMDTTDLGCKTHTHLALEELYKTYFTSDLGDRPNSQFANVGMLFTDGRTIARRFADDTKTQAKNAKDAGIELHVVDVPHRQGLADLADEFDELPSRPELLYNVTNQEDITNIVNDLFTRYFCGLPTFGGGDDPKAGCASVVFGIDVSCSIDLSNITKAIEIGKDIVQTSAPGHRFGAFTYDNNTVSEVPYFFGSSERLDNIDTELIHTACKTRTNRAITYAREKYFGANSTSNVFVIFGDGNEAPWNENSLAIRKAEAFKESNGIIIWVILTSNRDAETRQRGIEEQINVMASVNSDGTSLVFDHKDPAVITKITNYLDKEFPTCQTV